MFVKNYFSFMHKRWVEKKRYENHLLYPITRYGNHFVVFNSKLIVKLMSVTHFSVMVMLVLNFLLLMQQTPKFWKKFQTMSSVDFLFQYHVKDVTKMHVLCKICQWQLDLRTYLISVKDSIFFKSEILWNHNIESLSK